MNRDQSASSRLDDLSTNKASPPSSSITTSNSNASYSTVILQEEKEHRGSFSHDSSPRLASILLPPSEGTAARPRSAEGRVTSLNLPRHPSQSSRSHVHSLGTSRRRALHGGSLLKKDGMGHDDYTPNMATDDGLLNFGLVDDFALAPEDPMILEDVQRALKAKALRDSLSRVEVTNPASEELTTDSSSTKPSEDPRPSADATPRPFPATPPKPSISVSTRPSPSLHASPPKVSFPSYAHSPARSIESLSSSEFLRRTPLPVMVTSQDGTSCLDWSGVLVEHSTLEKEKSLLGRTFSLTKRRSKAKDRIANMGIRNSLDFRASQGELHAASLDSIRRAARRDTLSRAEKTKDELGRRYAFLSCRKLTGEPELDILAVVKSRHDLTNVHTPWLAWCRPLLLSQQKTSVWAITSDSIDEYLQTTGRRPARPSVITPPTAVNMSVTRSHSPVFGSSLPSPRSSLSTSPLSNTGERLSGRKPIELGRSLSANPVAKGIPTSSPLFRTLSHRDDMAHSMSVGNSATIPIEKHRSVDVARPDIVKLTNADNSPRSSLDRGSDSQPLSNLSSTEVGTSKKRKFRASLPAEKTGLSLESRTSTVSSIPNPFGVAQSHGAPTGGRLHLGVGNFFGRKRRGGDEVAGGNSLHSRSSVSDERDSAREGEGTKSDDAARSRGGTTFGTPGLDLRGFMARGKEVLNTSESEVGGANNGLLTAKNGQTFHRSGRVRDRERNADDASADFTPASVSGGEQRHVDALAAPGWSSKRGVRQAPTSVFKRVEREVLQEMLQRREEEEERENEIYKGRELLLIEANDHNRRIARLLKLVCVSIRDYENDQGQLAQALGFQHQAIPSEVLEAISADPAITLRHGKGCQAVEDSYSKFHRQQSLLTSYLSTIETTTERVASSDMGDLIHEAEESWRGLQARSEEIENQAQIVIPALNRVVEHMREIQKEYNKTQMIVETDYSEQSRLTDLEMIITESRAPRGWLEFAAMWIPEHVLEFIGGFIRFFGVPISEKFIRPFLWYFLRDRYYWKVYSTEPPPSQRAWYTRLGYWVVILSILAWYSTV